MKYVEFMTILSIYILYPAYSCVLDRNEHNVYPFMVKLVAYGKIKAHALLITPRRVVSAYYPVKEFATNKFQSEKVQFIGQLLGNGGITLCEAKRKAREQSGMFDSKYNVVLNIVVWVMEEEFNVTDNHPFLWTSLSEIESTRQNSSSPKNGDSCVLPLYTSEDPDKAKVKAYTIKFISGAQADHWSDVMCQNDTACLKKANYINFWAEDPRTDLHDRSWYGGAILLCGGKPIGTLSAVMEEYEFPDRRVILFEYIGFAAQQFFKWARSEWPTPGADSGCDCGSCCHECIDPSACDCEHCCPECLPSDI